MDLFLTDGRRVSPYKYAFLGRERIETELGSIWTRCTSRKCSGPTIRAPSTSGSRRSSTSRRCAIRFTEKNGTAFDSVVTKISFSNR